MKVTLCDETPGGPPFERAKGKPDMFIPAGSYGAFRGRGPMAGEPIATVVVPIKTVSEANRASSEHWRYRWRRSKIQNHATWAALQTRRIALGKQIALPVHVHLTRISPGKLDSGNLEGSFKYVQDSVAKFLGVDDGDEKRVSWSYAQERAKGYNVRIEFYRRAE